MGKGRTHALCCHRLMQVSQNSNHYALGPGWPTLLGRVSSLSLVGSDFMSRAKCSLKVTKCMKAVSTPAGCIFTSDMNCGVCGCQTSGSGNANTCRKNASGLLSWSQSWHLRADVLLWASLNVAHCPASLRTLRGRLESGNTFLQRSTDRGLI